MKDLGLLPQKISVLIEKLDQGLSIDKSDKILIAEALKKNQSLELEIEKLKQNNKQYTAVF